MTLTPRLRKFALTAHVIFSVGWLGAVAAYLALAIAGLTSQEAQVMRSSYLSMEVIGWAVIIPCSIAALLSGLVQSLGTDWGLFRHYWIVAKFVLTVGATIVLLVHMRAVTHMSTVAAAATLMPHDLRVPRIQLVVHAAGGLLVLIAIAALSVYKPWGLTPYGRRVMARTDATVAMRIPWRLLVAIGVIMLIAALAILHLAGGGMRGH